MKSKVKLFWVNKGVCSKNKWCLRLVNGTKGKILVHDNYNTKLEAERIGQSLLNVQF